MTAALRAPWERLRAVGTGQARRHHAFSYLSRQVVAHLPLETAVFQYLPTRTSASAILVKQPFFGWGCSHFQEFSYNLIVFD